MPKSYSDQERDYIRRRLKEETAKCLVDYGIRHTTVDEIVKRVGIPKGTFYLFYRSKELLLFEVIQEQQDEINTRFHQATASLMDAGPSVEALTEVIFDFYKEAERRPVLRSLDSTEVDLLIRKLPKEVVEEHYRDDERTIEDILSLVSGKGKLDARAVSAAFQALYFATLHKGEIDSDSYGLALQTLIRGIVMQIL